MRFFFQEAISVVETDETKKENISAVSDVRPIGNKLIAGLIIGLSFFLPLFFLSFEELPITFGKGILASVVVLAGFLIWLVARLKTGEITFPRFGMIPATLLLSFVVFVSALFSPSISVSLFGAGGETQTFAFIFVGTLTFLLVAISFSEWRLVMGVYMAYAAAFIVLFLFYAVRFIGGADVLSFETFRSLTSGPIGSWNDFGIFAAGIAIISLFSLYTLPHTRTSRVITYSFLILSLLSLFIVNFSIGWILLGIFSLIVFVYALSFQTERQATQKTRISFLPLIIVGISLICLLLSQQIGTMLLNKFGVSTLDARPTWGTTFSIAKTVLADDPLWGIGPNRFFNQWLLSKPNEINNTIFWNSDFNAGIGSIPSFIVTTGGIGIAAWLLLLAAFIAGGLKMMRHANPREKISHYFLLSSFIAAFYFWTVSIFYVPSYTAFFFAFLFSGIFTAAMTISGIIPVRQFIFSDNPRRSFFGVLVIIFFIIVSVVGLYISGQKTVAATIFNSGITAASVGDIDTATQKISKASVIDDYDLYYRSLADVTLLKMNSIIARATNVEKIDSLRVEFQELLGNAINASQKAIAFNTTDYRNWRTLARVYHAVVALNISGAYENAARAYEEARVHNPKSPALLLDMAQLELARGDIELAKNFISEALSLKNNYTDALYMLSQIELNEGKIKDAISSVEIASLINPNDPGVFFRLGFLRYSDKDYRGAISALDRAIVLQPQYANARYFLGLSYYYIGQTDKAIGEFNNIAATNPDNKEVSAIIKNLTSGKNPFTGLPEGNQFAPPIEE